MLCAVKRSRTVIVSILLLLIIIVFLNYDSNEETILPVKEPLSKSPIPIPIVTTTEEYDYEEIPIIPSWGEFKPTDVRYEKDIFFLETRG